MQGSPPIARLVVKRAQVTLQRLSMDRSRLLASGSVSQGHLLHAPSLKVDWVSAAYALA
jgi:hypothetical protein